MPKLNTDPKLVYKIWGWCQEAFRKCGHELTFPAFTDPTKTYQWRYASRLVQKIEEWEFDDNTARVFIQFAANYVKEKRLLRKGLSVFFQSNILEICYERMESECDALTTKLSELSSSKNFVDQRKRRLTGSEVLLERQRLTSPPNIVGWYSTKKISALYLALSISCTRALTELKKRMPNQREELPSDADLYCLRQEVLRDSELKERAREILGQDWRKLCPR